MKIAPPHLLRFTWIIKGACKGVKDCWCLLLKGSSSRCGLIPNKCWPSRKVTGAFTQVEIIGILLSGLVQFFHSAPLYHLTPLFHSVHFFTLLHFSLCSTFSPSSIFTQPTFLHSDFFTHPVFFSHSAPHFHLAHFFTWPTFSLGPLFHLAHFFTQPSFKLRPTFSPGPLFR